MNVQAARASGHLPVSHLLCSQSSPTRRRAIQAPARPNHQSWQRAPLDRWCSHGSCRRPLRRSSTQYGQTLSTQLRYRSICWTIHQFAQRSTPPPMWYAHSGTRRAASFQRDQMLQGRTVTHMNGGKYIPPNRKRLADDLLDKAEARETESLKDVLIRLARQKKSGSIVLDGRKSISKLPMVNFLFHCADGTWLIECVASNAVRGRRCCTTSPLVSRASRSRSAQRSDVGKHVPTSIAPNENDLALREQQSSLACATTCGSGRRGRIRPLSRCVYHRWC